MVSSKQSTGTADKKQSKTLKKPHIPRIEAFDIMRGFLLIAILNDHIHFFPNYLDWWGMRGQLLVSAAEGFFLLSGVVLGLVRGAKLVNEKFSIVNKLLLKRALQLYVTYVVTVILFTLIGWYIYPGDPGLKDGIMVNHDIWALIYKSLTFHYFYGWADYLRFYAVYLAISPLAFWLLRKGMWNIVLAVSLAVWLLMPDLKTSDFTWTHTQLVQLISWQPLFFIGIIIGFHWPKLTEFYTKHKIVLLRYVIHPMVLISFTLLALNIFAIYGTTFFDAAWATDLRQTANTLRNGIFLKEQMAMPRILLFLGWFWSWFWLVEKFLNVIKKYTGWFLIPIGTNSLYVYTVSAFIIFFVHLHIGYGSSFSNFLVVVGASTLIYVCLRTKFLMKIIPR